MNILKITIPSLKQVIIIAITTISLLLPMIFYVQSLRNEIDVLKSRNEAIQDELHTCIRRVVDDVVKSLKVL